MNWIGQPLSAGDLTQLFDGKPARASVSHHMQRLTKLEAIELNEMPTKRGIADVRYRLAQGPRNGR